MIALTKRNLAVALAVSVSLGLAPGVVLAQDAEPLCTVHAESEVIKIAICSENPADAVLAEEARAICADLLPCGVWFWTDADAAPSEAPENHDGLTAEQVVSAIGVYAGEQEVLVRIDEATDD